MSTTGGSGAWRRWSLVVVGVALLALIVVAFAFDPDPASETATDLSVSAAFALLVLATAGHLLRTDREPEGVWLVASRAMGGAAVFGALGAWAAVTIQGGTGATATYVAFAAAPGGAAGTALGLIDDRRRREYRRAQRVDRAIDASSDAIAVIDEEGVFVTANAAYGDLVGVDPDGLPGRHWQEVSALTEQELPYEEIGAELEATGEWRGTGSFTRRDDTDVTIDLTVSAFDSGGAVIVHRDVSKRTRTEGQLRQLQTASRDLLYTESAADVGAVTVDIAGDVLDWRLSSFWQHDAERDRLEMVSTTESTDRTLEELGLDGLPPLAAESTGMSVFEGDEIVVIDEYGDADAATFDLPLGTMVLAPVGDHGLLVFATDDVVDVTESERAFVDILRWTAEAALDRVDRERQLREQRQRLQTIVENVPVVVFAFDLDGVLTFVQGRGLDGTEVEPADLVGESVFDIFGDAAGEHVRAAIESALDGHARRITLTFADRVFETWYQPILEDDAVTGVIGSAIDVTESHERDRQLSALNEASHELSFAGSPDAVASVTVEIASDVLDKPFSTLWRYDEPSERLRPVAMADATRAYLADAGVGETLDPLGDDTIAMQAYRGGAVRTVANYGAVDGRAFPDVPLGTVVVVPVGDYGVLALGEAGIASVSEADRQHVELLAANAQTALERAQREDELRRRHRMVETLHEATSDLLAADSTETVCEVAVGAAERALDRPVVGIWLRDDASSPAPGSGELDGVRLVSVAQSPESRELFDEVPVYTARDESLSWEAYADGETRLYHDVRDADGVANPNTLIRSELIVPLGEYGVLNVGSALPGEFDATDVYVARLLAASTEAAFERTNRERELRDRTEELELRTSQMEFFNSILRHDVLNGMTVIRARGQFLAESLSGREREFAETIVRWSDDVTDIVGRVRSVLDTLTGTASISFEPVEVVAVVTEEIDRLSQTYPSVEFDTDLPAAAWVRADDLFPEVVGNVITNAVEHNETEGLHVTVTVETTDDRVRISVADNGRGIPDDRKQQVFRRGQTGHAKSTGSGFGLFFADAMIDAYGGEITIEDNDEPLPTGPDARASADGTDDAAGTDDADGRATADGAGGARFVIELERTTDGSSPRTASTVEGADP